jgi:hypothetical protein
MLWRHLCLVRAWSAAGLLGCTLLGAASPARADSDEPTPRPEPAVTATVSVLDARRTGDLSVEVRGAGQDHVKMTLRNTSAKRLNVVIPPGLVASSTAGQPGGGGGGRGFQSMGLGSVSNRAGSFGEFRVADSSKSTGLRSVGVKDDSTPAAGAVTVPAGQTVELSVASVCLNYGVTTPTPRDKFALVDVDDYSTDLRVRKALRSLATYGTSQGVAQAAMWNVCNNLPFELMAQQAGKVMNPREIALAARFVEAVDASASTDLVDPAYLQQGRLFVRVSGEGALARDAERLNQAMAGLRVLGLPVQVYDDGASRPVAAPALLVNVVLTGSQTGETRGRVLLSQSDASGSWASMGKTPFVEGSTLSVLDGPTLARVVDRVVGSTYVTLKPTKHGNGTTTFKVENRLPFTVARMALKTGSSSGAPSLELSGLGVAPARTGQVTVESPTARVERVELNGL